MKQHLTQDELIGYVHQTLTDAEREHMDRHLVACPACRTALTVHEETQRRLRRELRTALDDVKPPAEMTFAAVRTRMGRAPQRQLHRRRVVDFLPVGAALIGLLAALLGLVQQVEPAFIAAKPGRTMAFPTLACILFLVPVMSWGQHPRLLQPRRTLTTALAVTLWLGTAVVALYEIYLLRELFFRVYARLWQDPWPAVALGNWGVFFLSLGWITLVIGGGEHHYRHVGERRSWRLFGWTLVGELLILSLALFL
ncbi:MAG: anti-sigma factor family protein [Anaerolineae bacterium]